MGTEQPKQMQQPEREIHSRPHLEALPGDDATAAVDSQPVGYAGGGGPPSAPLPRGWGLWLVCAIGVIMASLSMFALSKETMTGLDYFGPHWPPRLADLRVWAEFVLLIIGSACMFTSLVCIHAKWAAKKLEANQQVKSLRAKRLDKMSHGTIFGVICNYIGAMLSAL